RDDRVLHRRGTLADLLRPSRGDPIRLVPFSCLVRSLTVTVRISRRRALPWRRNQAKLGPVRLVRRPLALLQPLRSLLGPSSGARLVPLSILAGAFASVAIGAGVAHAVPDPSDILPVSEVKPGMKGYGLTVMSGTTPEKFDIEVISTLHNFRPNQDLVIIKT